MTTLENNPRTESDNGVADEAPASEVKNPTYLDLVKATWKLAHDLSSWGQRDLFCIDGVNGYLRHFGLPELRDVDGNMERADSYLETWHAYQTWNTTGEVDPVDDQDARERLARRIRTYLRREEPKSIATMNEWLTELGIQPFEPPAPPRHAGRYDVSYTESREVNSERIQAALREQFPELDVQVRYVGRIA